MIKIIVLTMKSFLFSIASPGLGNVDGSIFSSLFAVSSFLNAKKKKIIIAIRAIPAIRPVFVRKSAKLYPRAVPIIIFGGSPHIVAEPPRLAQKISAKTIGTGLNLSNCESSTVTAARKRITVILSINIERTALIIINVTSIGITLYLTALAIVRQSQRKNPALAIPSTITIIPAIKIMVAQFIPLELSLPLPEVCQNSVVNMLLMFKVSIIAFGLLIQIANTIIIVARPQPRVTQWRGILSIIISANISTNITMAKICDTILMPLF